MSGPPLPREVRCQTAPAKSSRRPAMCGDQRCDSVTLRRFERGTVTTEAQRCTEVHKGSQRFTEVHRERQRREGKGWESSRHDKNRRLVVQKASGAEKNLLCFSLCAPYPPLCSLWLRSPARSAQILICASVSIQAASK